MPGGVGGPPHGEIPMTSQPSQLAVEYTTPIRMTTPRRKSIHVSLLASRNSIKKGTYRGRRGSTREGDRREEQRTCCRLDLRPSLSGFQRLRSSVQAARLRHGTPTRFSFVFFFSGFLHTTHYLVACCCPLLFSKINFRRSD